MSLAGLLDSPLAKLALEFILKMPVPERTRIVELVASTLGVRVGFWDTATTPPQGVPLLVEFEAEAGKPPKYFVASSNGEGSWLAFPSNTPIQNAGPAKNWAVIPS